MTTQPEAELESALIDQLQSLKYTRVKIKDQAAMLANLKQQLEIHNGNITLSKNEFELILNLTFSVKYKFEQEASLGKGRVN